MTYITEQIARAAGTDKANRRMRKAGRTQWDLGDWNCAVKEYYRLMNAVSQDPPIPHCVNSQLV